MTHEVLSKTMTLTPDNLFQKEMISGHLFKNRTVMNAYEILYSPKEEHEDDFLRKLYLLRNDTNINYREIVYRKHNEEINDYPHAIEYEYSYTHSVEKKILFGPSSINVVDNYRLFLISREVFIVEVTSTFSGFMLMDTFFTRLQYTFRQEDNNDMSKEKDIGLTVKFMIQFIKPNPFQSIATSSGIEDNQRLITELVIPQMDTVLEVEIEQPSEIKTVNSDYGTNENEDFDSSYIELPDPVGYCLYEIFC